MSDKPLLYDAVQRLHVVDPDHTLILTNSGLTKAIRKLLGNVPREISSPSQAGRHRRRVDVGSVRDPASRRPGRDDDLIHADWAIVTSAVREALIRAEEVARARTPL